MLENCRFEIDDAELEWTYPAVRTETLSSTDEQLTEAFVIPRTTSISSILDVSVTRLETGIIILARYTSMCPYSTLLQLLTDSYRHLKPGGFVEVIEHAADVSCDDGSYPENCALRDYMRNLGRSLEIMGLASMPRDGRKYIEKAGFVDIKVSRPFFDLTSMAANLANRRNSDIRHQGRGLKIRR